MKILFVLDYYVPHIGGAETLFRNVIERLAARGHRVSVLTCRHNAEVPAFEKTDSGVEIYRVGSGRIDLIWNALGKTGRRLAKEADVIQTTTYSAAIPASVLGLAYRKKVVLTVLEVFWKLWYRFMGWKGFFYALFERAIFLFPFERFLCISQYTKNNLRILFGIEDAKLSTVYCWLDSDFWNESTPDKANVAALRKELRLENAYSALYFGRPGVSKGLEHFVAAMPEIAHQIPDFRAVLIVSWDDKERSDFIQAKIRESGMESRVEWIPGVKYSLLPDYLSTADVVVVPSLVEGFGFSAAEACSLWRNVVVSWVASLPEVVFGKVAFAEPGNPADIVRAVVDMKSWRHETIAKKSFSWEDNVDRTEKTYFDIVQNGR